MFLQIFDLETTYLDETKDIGNIFTGKCSNGSIERSAASTICLSFTLTLLLIFRLGELPVKGEGQNKESDF
jgi:hypothetical protein